MLIKGLNNGRLIFFFLFFSFTNLIPKEIFSSIIYFKWAPRSGHRGTISCSPKAMWGSKWENSRQSSLYSQAALSVELSRCLDCSKVGVSMERPPHPLMGSELWQRKDYREERLREKRARLAAPNFTAVDLRMGNAVEFHPTNCIYPQFCGYVVGKKKKGDKGAT